MATVTRQPFAPLDGSRLQSLTSLKNRQNAISTPPSSKRKASDVAGLDDSENVDPIFFSKRSKGSESLTKDLFKPSHFVLTKASSTPTALPSKEALASVTSPVRASSPRPRSILNPKSPAARLNTNVAKSSPLTAPAGRSPTRGSKRIGILSNRRRTASPFTRVNPPSFGLSPAPFSLDAALQGTVPSYASKSQSSASLSNLQESELKSAWFFDIHEDTPEQEMTNLLQHSTCVLDISSDEESEQKARRDRAEGRDKENIPPADDVSQTSSRARAPAGENCMDFEKQRDALGELNVEEFYAEGCDQSSIVIIPADEEDDAEPVVVPAAVEPLVAAEEKFEFSPEIKLDASATVSLDTADIDALMGSSDAAQKAAVLEPMEGTGDSFELWESGSAKDDAEGGARSPSPVPASPASDTTEIIGVDC